MIDTNTIIGIVVGIVYISVLVVSIMRSWRNTWPMASRVLLIMSGVGVVSIGLIILGCRKFADDPIDGLGCLYGMILAAILSVIFYITSMIVLSILMSWRNKCPMSSRILLLSSGLLFVITIGCGVAYPLGVSWDIVGYLMIGAITLSIIFYIAGMMIVQQSQSLKPRYKGITVYVHVIVMIILIWLSIYVMLVPYYTPFLVNAIMLAILAFGVRIGTSVWQDVRRYPTWYRTIWLFFAVIGCVCIVVLGRGMVLGLYL